MRGSHSASGREEREGRECGNKDRGKKERDGEWELCATINHLLGLEFIWIHFFCFEIHSTQERNWGMGRKRGKQQHGGREEERRWGIIHRAGNYLGVRG